MITNTLLIFCMFVTLMVEQRRERREQTHPPKSSTICVQFHSLEEVQWSQTVPVVDKLPKPLKSDWQMRFLWSRRTLYVPSEGKWVQVERAHYRYKHGPCS